ncbi:MAG: hypothetical protein RL490_1258 [Pseudomonadota bacterium]|jgi:outer membrane protein OmpA-like peptidoglycan-associated protein
MNTSFAWGLSLLAMLLHAPAAHAADCDTAGLRVAAAPGANPVSQYQQGMAALQRDDFAAADQLLRQAYAAIGNIGDASQARALERTTVARLVEVALAAGQLERAYFRLRLLRALVGDTAEPWMTQVMQAADAATVAVPEQAGTLALLSQCRSIGVAPKADIRILFDSDSSELTAESKRQVTQLAATLATAKIARAIVRGHTDSHGSDAYNLTLSQRRAETVVRALIDANPAFAGMLTANGAGETQLLYPQAGAQSDRLNRRVELVFGDGGTPQRP